MILYSTLTESDGDGCENDTVPVTLRFPCITAIALRDDGLAVEAGAVSKLFTKALAEAKLWIDKYATVKRSSEIIIYWISDSWRTNIDSILHTIRRSPC